MSHALLIVLMLGAAPSAPDRQDLERALISLDADARLFVRSVRGDQTQQEREWLSRAAAGRTQSPDVTSALFDLALQQSANTIARDDLLIEAARAQAAIGRHQEAQTFFLEAANTARDSTRLVSAVEGFAAATALLGSVSNLPPIERYVSTLRYGAALDSVAEETLYSLGKVLAQQGDTRAIDVMAPILSNSPRGRRALFVTGTLYLRLDNKDRAREAFQQAAAAKLYHVDAGLELSEEELQRDQAVYETALLAVGRLAFDAGDVAAGVVAYQNIPTQSPRYLESLLELGWLAMEANDEPTAFYAFHALTQAAPDKELGREAQLLKGYVLLRQGAHQQAAAHYAGLSKRWSQTRTAMLKRVATIADLADLSRDCEARRQAENDPLLADIVGRPEVAAAQQLAQNYAELLNVAPQLRAQVASLNAVLSRQDTHNPLTMLRQKRQTAGALLKRTQDLLQAFDQAVLRGQWRAQSTGTTATEPCCLEPRGRLVRIQQQLEETTELLTQKEQALVHALETLRDHVQEQVQAHERQAEALSPTIAQTQRELVQAAVDATSHGILRLVIESDAGVLESTWLHKEAQRSEMAVLEQQRKSALRKFDSEHLEEAEME